MLEASCGSLIQCDTCLLGGATSFHFTVGETEAQRVDSLEVTQQATGLVFRPSRVSTLPPSCCSSLLLPTLSFGPPFPSLLFPLSGLFSIGSSRESSHTHCLPAPLSLPAAQANGLDLPAELRLEVTPSSWQLCSPRLHFPAPLVVSLIQLKGFSKTQTFVEQLPCVFPVLSGRSWGTEPRGPCLPGWGARWGAQSCHALPILSWWVLAFSHLIPEDSSSLQPLLTVLSAPMAVPPTVARGVLSP